jgi:hypothetical protein
VDGDGGGGERGGAGGGDPGEPAGVIVDIALGIVLAIFLLYAGIGLLALLFAVISAMFE